MLRRTAIGLFLLTLGFLPVGTMAAIEHRDGAGEWEQCPVPKFCTDNLKAYSDASRLKQDNGYHNMLQNYHSAAKPILNVYMSQSADMAVTPPTPPKYTIIVPPEYSGVPR